MHTVEEWNHRDGTEKSMKSLTHKLAVIFLIMTVPTCVIGVNALWSVRTAFAALEANDRALKNLTSLLQSAGETLRESNALQESAGFSAVPRNRKMNLI